MAQGLARASNMKNLRQEVQRVCSGTSDRFVPEPSRKVVQSDILIAIRSFKNVVRKKKFWRDQKQSTKPEENEIEEKSIFMATGLHRYELPGNYPVFTVVMVIYTFIRRISIITLPPNFF